LKEFIEFVGFVEIDFSGEKFMKRGVAALIKQKMVAEGSGPGEIRWFFLNFTD
jgi:hypothetical protein